MKVEIRPTHPSDIELIVANLREEFPVSIDVKKMLTYKIEVSTQAFSGFIDDDIACIWGLYAQTILNDSVYLWLLTTKLVEERPFIFVRHSQMVAQEILKSYSKIIGCVLESNELSVKWLRWLGCEIEYLEPGVLGFELRRA